MSIDTKQNGRLKVMNEIMKEKAKSDEVSTQIGECDLLGELHKLLYDVMDCPKCGFLMISGVGRDCKMCKKCGYYHDPYWRR